MSTRYGGKPCTLTLRQGVTFFALIELAVFGLGWLVGGAR